MKTECAICAAYGIETTTDTCEEWREIPRSEARDGLGTGPVWACPDCHAQDRDAIREAEEPESMTACTCHRDGTCACADSAKSRDDGRMICGDFGATNEHCACGCTCK